MPRARPRSSLKAKALQLLALREQSRLELRRKLLRHAASLAAAERVERAAERADQRIDRVDERSDGDEAADENRTDSATQAVAVAVDAVLEWLGAHGYLSDERFAESRVNARAARFGNLRIRSELGQHGVALPPAAEQALAASEAERAAAVRQRRFAAPPADAKERAAQERFLLGRGFAAETIRRLFRSL